MFGFSMRLIEVILADLLVVGEGALLDTVFGAVETGKALFNGEVQQQSQVGPAAADGDVGDGADLGGGEAVAAQLDMRGCWRRSDRR